MLRPVDLKSIGVQGLNDEIFEEYQHYLGIKFRGREINDISSLVSDEGSMKSWTRFSIIP
ncbi:hypothetical protein [Pediococcus damnosus]|uniref:hypothetical protein n=1 Tax=Pediococcus damnosus TaxID=51663 RepID=UPI003F6D4AC0